jgi:hypothetical protein
MPVLEIEREAREAGLLGPTARLVRISPSGPRATC